MTIEKELPGWISRQLVKSKEKAVLATVMRNGGGTPYASLVLTASDYVGNPLIYISDLAEHTKNIWQDQRVSMVFENTSGLYDPLSGPRVTLQGTMSETKDPLLKERFFKRHEQSRKYGNSHEFYLFQMNVERVHLVAGFGRIHWIGADKYLFDYQQASTLAASEDGIVQHMNDDHSDAIDLIANNLIGVNGQGWKMIGIDPEGFDVRKHDQISRFDFEKPLINAESSRELMVDLVKQARDKETKSHASV